MAKPGSAPALPGFTVWSPDPATHRNTIHRRYVQIPSEQQKLLGDKDAWSAGAIPNVPPKVLEDVRRHHIKHPWSGVEVVKQALSSQPQSPVTATSITVPASPDHATREMLNSQTAFFARSTPERSEPNRDRGGAEDSDAEGEPAGTPTTWSRSPSAHLRPPCPQEELSTAASATGERSSEQRGLHPTDKALSRTAFLTDFPPSSSLASETGLEVEVPRAITDVIQPMRPAPAPLLEPTPPSAQVIPCSLAERTSAVRAPDAKRPRLMVHPTAMLESPEPVSQKRPSRLAISKPAVANIPRSSSPVLSSSPPIPEAAALQPMEMSPVLQSAENEHVLATTSQLSLLVTASQLASGEGSSNSVGRIPPNGPPSQVPFTAFKVTYPDYRGSVRDFVRGVMCILQLQRDKELPEFLYDDFIRVFSGDYLRYIGTLGDNQPALRAIHWYNENVSKPLYTKGILNKDNINDVANRHTNDVRAIKHKLRASKAEARHREARVAPDTAREKTPVPQGLPTRVETPHVPREVASASPELATTPRAELSSHVAPRTERSLSRRESRGVLAPPENSSNLFGPSSAPQPRAEAGRPRTTDDATATRPGVFQTQVDLPLPAIESSVTPRVTKIQLPVATAVPSATRTQLGNPDIIPETAIRRRAAPRASTGVLAAEPRAAFKQPKKTTKNAAEERAMRFREFLMQKKTQSSAPGGSTPS